MARGLRRKESRFVQIFTGIAGTGPWPGELLMKTNRFWIEILALGSSIACALALLIATLGTAAVAVGGPSESGQADSRAAEPVPAKDSSSLRPQTREGMVTCSRCGAKHSADLGKTARDCTRQCVQGGSTFTLVDGDKTYRLDGDVQLLRKVAGQRARVVGVVQGNTINVSSVAASS